MLQTLGSYRFSTSGKGGGRERREEICRQQAPKTVSLLTRQLTWFSSFTIFLVCAWRGRGRVLLSCLYAGRSCWTWGKKTIEKLKPANTRVQKQCVWKERLGRWSDKVNLPDPCGGSQTFDISRNFSSSCMTVRFDKYCFTLRDIMDCVTKQNAKQSKIEQDPRLTWRIEFSNVNWNKVKASV